MANSKRERTEALKMSSQVDEAKSRLMHILSRLEDEGTARATMQLASIIGRLEDWQNSQRH
jgi:hypothetical protein